METEIINRRKEKDTDEKEFISALRSCLVYLIEEVEQRNYQDTLFFLNLAIQSLQENTGTEKC